MKRRLSFLFAGILPLALASSCILFNAPPEILSIYWATENIDESFWTKSGESSPGATAFRYFAVSIDEPDGPDDIVLIEVTDPDGYTWKLKDVGLGIDHYVEGGDFWGGWRRYYSVDTPHKTCLGVYSVLIRDSAEHEDTGTVSFYFPGADSDTGNEDVYSEDFGGVRPPGDNMIFRATGLSGTNNGTTVSINFSVDDPRVINGYIWFYDDTAEYITWSDWFSEREGAGWLDSGGNNVLTLTAGDLDLGGYSLSDIDGFHVVLCDGGQFSPELTYYDHRSVSVYTTFP